MHPFKSRMFTTRHCAAPQKTHTTHACTTRAARCKTITLAPHHPGSERSVSADAHGPPHASTRPPTQLQTATSPLPAGCLHQTVQPKVHLADPSCGQWEVHAPTHTPQAHAPGHQHGHRARNRTRVTLRRANSPPPGNPRIDITHPRRRPSLGSVFGGRRCSQLPALAAPANAGGTAHRRAAHAMPHHITAVIRMEMPCRTTLISPSPHGNACTAAHLPHKPSPPTNPPHTSIHFKLPGPQHISQNVATA